MRRSTAIQRLKRAEVAWMFIGFLVVQIGIGLGVDQFWAAIRDPEFDGLLRQLQVWRAEAPDRPLVLALGSSRTGMGFRPDRLGNLANAPSPLVYNFAIPSGGPMMEQVTLRRLQAAGIRPDLLLVEIMPMSLSRANGAPIEQRHLDSARLNSAELRRLLPYYRGSQFRLWYWGAARFLPCYHHQAELNSALGLDLPANGPAPNRAVGDHFGWRGTWPGGTPGEIKDRTTWQLKRYSRALADPHVASGPLEAFRDLLSLCREQDLPVILVMPPNGSAFQSYGPAAEENHAKRVVDMAHEFEVPLVDARTWVTDDGFSDGHHLTEAGADLYTKRLGQEVLRPHGALIGHVGKGCASLAKGAHSVPRLLGAPSVHSLPNSSSAWPESIPP